MQLKFQSLILLLAAIISVIGKSLEKLQPSQAEIQNGLKDSTFNIKLHHQHSGENDQLFLSRRFWDWDFEFSIFPFFGLFVKSTTPNSLTTVTARPKEVEKVSTTNRNEEPIRPVTTTQITDNPNESETVESNTNSDSIVSEDAVDEVVVSPTEENNTDTDIVDPDNFSDNDASTGPDTEESDVEEEMNTGDIIEGGN